MKFNRKSYIFIQENAFENVVSQMAAILSQPQCVESIIILMPMKQPRIIWVNKHHESMESCKNKQYKT